MCIQDWRLGRLVRTQRIAWDLDSPASYALSNDPNRVGWHCLFNIDSATTATWMTISWDAGGSLLRSLNNPEFMCSLTTHGDLPTKAVTFAGLTTTLSGYLFIWTMPEEYIAAALEEFRRTYNLT